MKNIIIAIAIVSISTAAFAQNYSHFNGHRGKNVISANIFGDVSIISLNYERLYEVNSNLMISGKIGLGYNEEAQFCLFGPCSTPPDKFTTITQHLTANFGEGKALLELGFGGTLFSGDSSKDRLAYPGPGKKYLFYPLIGLRIHPRKIDGFSFRVYGYFPKGIMNYDIFDGYLPIGFSLGVAF